MKNILCARPRGLWSGLSSENFHWIEGPESGDPWVWDDSPDLIDGLFCSTLPDNLDAFTRLKWVQIDSSGFSQLIAADLPKRGIDATNAAGVFDVPIAEWCVAMMVALARDFPTLIHHQAACIWDRDSRFQKEIRGSTVGFWGYGGLARETARLSIALGMRVHVMARGRLRNRSDSFVLPGTGDPEGALPDQVFTTDQWEEFLGGLDYLVMALPLTDSTRGICDENHLRALPRSAFILNPARGPLIVEKPLVDGLREGWFAGAALDTHYAYPLPSDHPLWKLPNVILTPHISGSTGSPGYVDRVRQILKINAGQFAKGAPLLNRIPSADLRPGLS